MTTFQIVQMDPDAAKWIGFAKQQCKRIIDNGTKDFYREWPLGDATVKAKSYGGTVKLWLVSTGGDLIISRFFGAAIPPDGSYYTATDGIKYDSTSATLMLRKKGYSSVTTNSFTQGWPGLPNQRKSSWVVLNTQTFSVDSVTGHKLFSVTYVALKATGKTKTVIYDINASLPGAAIAYFWGSAPLGVDTISVFQIYDPALATSKYIACSRNDGTFCEVTAAAGFSITATQNAVWVVDGSVFQRVNRVAGVLTATRTNVPSSAAGIYSTGLASIGGCSSTATNISLWKIDETLSVVTKTYTSADIAALIGVAGTYVPQVLSVSCTDSDVVSSSYWQSNSYPYAVVGIRATLTGISILVPLLNEGQLIGGGILGDGLYGTCISNGTLGYANDYATKAFDSEGILQDTTEIVHTDSFITPAIAGVSSRAVYVWDAGSTLLLRRFDRAAKKWGFVSPPSGAWSSFAPFVYSTPDVDFVFQRATSPTRTTISSADDPAFTVTIAGLWDAPNKIYYDAKTRTLVIANQIAVINVGRPDMAFVQSSALVFKPPTAFDASGNFIAEYQRPSSNIQSAVFTYPQAESWGRLWDTQIAAMQPALPP